MNFAQVGAFSVRVWDGIPADYQTLRRRASLVAEFDLQTRDSGQITTVAIASKQEEISILISQHRPTPLAYFPVGVLIVPETNLALLEVSERLLAFDLSGPRQLWEDHIEYGFLGCARYDDTIVVSGELSLDAFDLNGRWKWSMFVEPPWNYALQDETIKVDVMGRIQTFDLRIGPEGDRST